MHWRYRPRFRQIITHGLAAGLIAGMVMALTEMLIDYSFGKGFWMPIRMIASIGMGTAATDPGYPLWRALLAGAGIHLGLSALYGMIFVGGLAFIRQLGAHAVALVLAGMLFGAALWYVNFEVIAPRLWPQFGDANAFRNGFFAHAFGFGMPLGAYVAAVRPGRTAVARAVERFAPPRRGIRAA